MQKISSKNTKLSESEIQSKLIKNIEDRGWMVVKLIQTNTNGIPDLLCLRAGKCVFVEVKKNGKKSSPLQVYVQERLRNAGVNVFETSNPDFLI